MFKKIIIISLILLSSYFVIYAKSIQSDISNNIIRLHVVANSDSTIDQIVKIEIRDALLNHMHEHNFTSKSDAINYLSQNLIVLENLSNNILKKYNLNYIATVRLDESFFNMREYDGFSIPSGKYTAIKVLLGNGTGQNWWCIMFPPLCFTDESYGDDAKTFLKDSLSPQSYTLISSDIEFRFKFLDFINSI